MYIDSTGYFHGTASGTLYGTVSFSGTNFALKTDWIPDCDPPVVTLSGSTPLTILQNVSYTESGAIWTDNIDGSGTLSVASSGTVDTATPGIYTLEYTYTDVAGNSGNTVTRSVEVLATHTVRFLDHDNAVLDTQTVVHASGAVVPVDPTRTGYTFSGWTGGTLTNIQADTDFTAQYTINSYTLSFDSAGGTTVADITGDYNTTVTAPTAPTRTGYTFA